MSARSRPWAHEVRYVGGGVFEIAYLVGGYFVGGGFVWPRRHARAVSRAEAVAFLGRHRIRPNRALAIDLGLADGRARARVVGGGSIVVLA